LDTMRWSLARNSTREARQPCSSLMLTHWLSFACRKMMQCMGATFAGLHDRWKVHPSHQFPFLLLLLCGRKLSCVLDANISKSNPCAFCQGGYHQLTAARLRRQCHRYESKLQRNLLDSVVIRADTCSYNMQVHPLSNRVNS